MSVLTGNLWRDLERAMTLHNATTDEQLTAIIDGWLKAELDNDAVLRRRSEEDREAPWHAGAVVERTPDGEPDRVVEWLSKQRLAELERSVLRTRKELGQSRYIVAPANEAHLERGFRHQVFEGAIRRHKSGDTSAARRHVVELFEKLGLDIDPQSDLFDDAVRLMTRAHRDLLDAVNRRDLVLWRPKLDDDPASALVARLRPSEVHPAPAAPALTGTSIQQAVALWGAEARKLDKVSEGRISEYQKAVDLFVGWAEADLDLSDVSPTIAGRFREDLVAYPLNASKRPAYRDLSIKRRIAKARADGDQATLSVPTIKGNYLDPLRALFDWAKSTGRVASNPFSGVTVSGGKASGARAGRSDFSEAQLRTLFSAPLFTGAAAESGTRLYLPGDVRVSDWRYWIPLLALFSGARLNELAGLETSDFVEGGEIPYFHIRPSSERRLKTAASTRVVPVHAGLIELGLLDLVERIRASGGGRVFPDLKPGPRGHLSHTPSKFYGRLIDRVLGTDGTVVFHSFRHTFITAMREAGVAKEVRTALVGHENGDTHDGYGKEPMSRLNQAVQSVSFPSLDMKTLQLPAL